MSLKRWAIFLVQTMVMLGGPLCAGAAAAPDPGALARCAAIAAPDARLACYDALSNGAQRAAPTTPAPASGATPLYATPAPSATSPSPASPPTPAPAPGSVPSADPRNFGLNEIPAKKSPLGPPAIQARIAKVVNTRYGRNYVVLDNGQTWVYTDSDEDARLGPGDQVTIKRASLGSFMMKTPSKHSYHVRRLE